MEPNQEDERKRKHLEDSGTRSAKKCKYNSVLALIQKSKYGDDSEKELESIIEKNFDVDYFDEQESDCTPLYFAVERGYLEWTKLLLEKGADQALALTEHDDGSISTLSDIAWRNGKEDILEALLLADGPFPSFNNSEDLNRLQKTKIKEIYDRNELFHEQIAKNLLVEVEGFVRNNPKTKHAYNISNQCALTTALKLKNFKIYAFLRSEGFLCGIDDKHDLLIERLEQDDRILFKREIQNYFPETEFIILELLTKSHLGMKNDRTHSDDLKTYYKKLNENHIMQPILRIIASEKKLSLIFDFNRANIQNLDPLRCPLRNKFYSVSGRADREKILIAAKQASETDILGVLAQEMTHFALLKVFANKFLPYCKDSKKQKKNMKRL